MRASDLAARLGGALEGADVEITACAGLEEARPGDLSFCKDAKHVPLVQATKASAILLPPDWTHGAPCAIIRVADPNHACMAAAEMFAPPAPVRAPGVHPTAIVDPSVRLGGDGYGYNTTMENGVPKIEKIPQLGIVELGDGVEIGSNTTIDRARIGRTYIGPMTKIDNLVQIGHNVKVAGYSGIIAQAGVAGSTQIGTGCLIWAQAGISGHIKIADGVQVGPQAGVPQTLDGSEKYVVGTPATTLKNVAAISLAPKMIMKLRQDVKALKGEVAKLAAKEQP